MTARPAPVDHMPAGALVDLLRFLDAAGIPVWPEGGWGGDTLLERETRPHQDVDLVLAIGDTPRLIATLAPRGFALREGTPLHAFVLADGGGLAVDVHAGTLDAAVRGIYRMTNRQDRVYPAEGFTRPRGRQAGSLPVAENEGSLPRARLRTDGQGSSRHDLPRRTLRGRPAPSPESGGMTYPNGPLGKPRPRGKIYRPSHRQQSSPSISIDHHLFP